MNSVQTGTSVALAWVSLPMFAMALIGIVLGRIAGRNGESVSRAEHPGRFWWGVGAYAAGGIGCLAYYFYREVIYAN